jgi:hypothetical protein
VWLVLPSGYFSGFIGSPLVCVVEVEVIGCSLHFDQH